MRRVREFEAQLVEKKIQAAGWCCRVGGMGKVKKRMVEIKGWGYAGWAKADAATVWMKSNKGTPRGLGPVGVLDRMDGGLDEG